MALGNDGRRRCRHEPRENKKKQAAIDRAKNVLAMLGIYWKEAVLLDR